MCLPCRFFFIAYINSISIIFAKYFYQANEQITYLTVTVKVIVDSQGAT